MSVRPSCYCPVCELEHSLLAELRHPETESEYRKFATPSSVLSAFPTCDDLLLFLREFQKTDADPSRPDEVLGELLRVGRDPVHAIGRHLVVLILMPAIHRTSTQITAGFPSLPRDDIAQHLVTSVLDIVDSPALQAQTSHFAFTITRAMRRSAFRWALREADFAAATTMNETVLHDLPTDAAQNFEPGIILGEFLSRCLSRGLLTPSEHELLVLFKIEGISSEVLAGRSNISEVAFRHRMQRVLDRLRHVARPQLPATQPDDAAA